MIVDQRKEEREGGGEERRKEGREEKPSIFLATMLGPAYTFRLLSPGSRKDVGR